MILPAHISRLRRLAGPFKRAVRAIFTAAVQRHASGVNIFETAIFAASYLLGFGTSNHIVTGTWMFFPI